MAKALVSPDVGTRFGRGVVIDNDIRLYVGIHGRGKGIRGCRLLCDCGNAYEACLTNLVGSSKIRSISCGCYNLDLITELGKARTGEKNPAYRHGLESHPLYSCWHGMLARCENPDLPKYVSYGARGIKVCAEWHDVATFIADIERLIGPRPDGYSLDRTDNDGNYEPGNVRWATPHMQRMNQRGMVAA
jgi:hypothetical protein